VRSESARTSLIDGRINDRKVSDDAHLDVNVLNRLDRITAEART